MGSRATVKPVLRIIAALFAASLMAAPRDELARQAAEPSVGVPAMIEGPAERFARMEFALPLEATYTNPFDPDDIRVDAHIRLPDGQTVVVPAFYYQGWEPENGKTQMQLWVRYRRLPEQDGWRVRYAPSHVGLHQLHAVVRRNGSPPLVGPATPFSVAPSGRPGFVQVAASNPMYFSDSGTGRPFVGFGTNVAWTRSQDPGDPLPCYEYYFGRAVGKMNATRVWLCHWAWLEWTPAVKAPGTNWEGYAGLGYYNQQIAVALDRVFRLADEASLRVMLVTEDNNEHFGEGKNDQWAANPYNAANGGPCAQPQDVFSSEPARAWYRKRLRYIVARWGAETALWAIDSWNDYSTPNEAQLSWLREMRDEVHALTQGWRPLIYGSNFAREANAAMDYAQAGSALHKDRPNVIQECHYTDDSQWFRPVLRQQLWHGLATGKAAAMVWPHATVDRTSSWDVFQPAMEFARSLPLLEGGWHPLVAEATGAESDSPPPYQTLVELAAYGDVPSWGQRATEERFVVHVEQGDQWLTGFCPNLYSPGRKAWRRPPTIVTELPYPGALILDAAEIGGGEQVLQVTVDGTPAKTTTFAGGRRLLKDSERWTRVPLSAGAHELRLDNVGQDWLRLRRLYLVWANPEARQLVRVEGRTNGRAGFAYVRNLTYSRIARDVVRQQPLNLHSVSLQLRGINDRAHYRVQVLDPDTGTELHAEDIPAENGFLPLSLERLPADVAVRFEQIP